MQIAKAIAGFTGPEADDLRKAIGKKDRKKMAGMRDRFFEGARSTDTPDRVIDELWAVNEAAADYSLQPLARRVLRADRLPHGVAQGELPGRVHGRADLVGHVHQGQGAVLRLALRGDGHRGAPAGRERVRPRLRRDRRQHPLRARGGQGRGRRGRGRDHHRARVGRAVHVDLGLLRAGGLPRGEQEARSSASSSRARSTRSARRARACSRCMPQAPGAGVEVAAGRAARAGLDLRRPGAGGGRRRQPVRPPAPAGPVDARRPQAAERVGEGDARPLPLLAPAEGGAPGAAREGRVRPEGPGRQEGRRLGDGRRHDRRVQAHPHEEGRPDDVRHARRPRGPGRDARLQLGVRVEREQDRHGQGAARARPRRPSRARRDQADRAGGRGVRAVRRGGRGRRASRRRSRRSSGGSCSRWTRAPTRRSSRT